MSIDVSSLHLPQAKLERRENAPKMYNKMDSAKAKAQILENKLDENPRDLLELSGKAAASLEALSPGSSKTVNRICNYSSDVFFHRDMPSQANADGSYTIGGVSFSAEELSEARSVTRAAADSISAGPGRNTNLDYRNYAQMAVAENAVGVYASSHLNEKQQQVVMSAMRDYNAGLVDAQNSYLEGLQRGETAGILSDYYGTTRILTQDMADALNSFKAELSQITGHAYRPSVAGESGGYEQLATNKELIGQINSLFSDTDLTDSSVFQSKLDAYSSLMRPVYQAQGIRPQDLGSVIANDQNKLSGIFQSILGASRKSIDMYL